MNHRNEFEALSKGAYLEVLLPSTNDFDAVALLRDGKPEEIKRAPSRKHLFFDERSKFQIVLRTAVAEDAIRTLLPHLGLTISAHATNAVPEGPGNASAAAGKHDLASVKSAATSNVNMVPVGDYTYVIWKPVLHLARPRARLQRPAIYFTANLNLQNSSSATFSEPEKQYLPTFEPLPANVLESLHHDPSLGSSGEQITVSETRVTKVSPSASQLEDVARPLRGATKRAFPAVPAFFMRLGYSAMADAVIASLHVEVSPLITSDLLIDDVRFEMPGTAIQSLNEAVWPQRAQPGDEVILLYRIENRASNTTIPRKDADLALVSLHATASFDENSSIEVETQWPAQVDMSHSSKPVSYKWSRPMSAAYTAHKRMPSQSSSRPSLHDISQFSAKDGEIIFTFTAPPTTNQGSDVEIQVQCVNKSNRSRRFALVTAQRRGSTSSTIKPRFEKRIGSTDTAVTATPHDITSQEVPEQHGVLTLTPDVRIGPVTAGACFETSLKYHTTGAGMLGFGTIRIIDLESRQTLDVAELPDVVALEQ
ncbi:hypothetical protein Q7P37_001329 [Cladosporium fusiforme]